MKSVAFYIRNTSQFETIIAPYSVFLKQFGYQTIILHINTLTPELNKPHQLPENIYAFDISEHTLSELSRFISDKAVLGFVAINFHSTLDILLNLFFKAKNIPTLYMEHGVLSEKPGQRVSLSNRWLSIRRQTVFIQKYLSFLMRYPNKLIHFKILLKSLLKQQYTQVKYSAYLLYAKNSFHKIIKTLIINEREVNYSGYPITLYNTIKPASTLSDPYYIYIHQPYVFHKMGTCSYQDEFNFLTHLNQILQRDGKRLVIKLHPVEPIGTYQKALDSTITFVVSNEDLPAWIQNAEGVIGHYSTVLFMAVKFNKPIVQITPLCWPKNQHFEIFKDVAIQSNTLEDFSLLLHNQDQLTQKLSYYQRFIDAEIGAHNSYEHRTKQILNLLVRSQ